MGAIEPIDSKYSRTYTKLKLVVEPPGARSGRLPSKQRCAILASE